MLLHYPSIQFLIAAVQVLANVALNHDVSLNCICREPESSLLFMQTSKSTHVPDGAAYGLGLGWLRGTASMHRLSWKGRAVHHWQRSKPAPRHHYFCWPSCRNSICDQLRGLTSELFSLMQVHERQFTLRILEDEAFRFPLQPTDY